MEINGQKQRLEKIFADSVKLWYNGSTTTI
jgi:hypothetical protein